LKACWFAKRDLENFRDFEDFDRAFSRAFSEEIHYLRPQNIQVQFSFQLNLNEQDELKNISKTANIVWIQIKSPKGKVQDDDNSEECLSSQIENKGVILKLVSMSI
jgi:hypothetical protein